MGGRNFRQSGSTGAGTVTEGERGSTWGRLSSKATYTIIGIAKQKPYAMTEPQTTPAIPIRRAREYANAKIHDRHKQRGPCLESDDVDAIQEHSD